MRSHSRREERRADATRRPAGAPARGVLALQRSLGNRATGRMLQRWGLPVAEMASQELGARAQLRADIEAIAAGDIRGLWSARRDDFLAVASDSQNTLGSAQLYQIWLRYWMDRQAEARPEAARLEAAVKKADPNGFIDNKPRFDAGVRGVFPADYEDAADRLAAANYYSSELIGVRDWLENSVDGMHNRVTLEQINAKAVEIIKAKELHGHIVGFALALASTPIRQPLPRRPADDPARPRTFPKRVLDAPLTGPTARSSRTVAGRLRQLKMTFREYWARTYGLGRVEDSVSLHTGFADAELTYIKLIEDTPGREAGIFRNARTGEHAVVQGRHSEVAGPAELLEDTRDRWICVEHYHPEWGKLVQVPSKADFNALLVDYGEIDTYERLRVLKGGESNVITQRISSRIRYRDPVTGEYHFTTFGYEPLSVRTGTEFSYKNPDLDPIGSFFVQVETSTGAKVDYSFKSINESFEVDQQARLNVLFGDHTRHVEGVRRGEEIVKAKPGRRATITPDGTIKVE